ncbi:helix-turn-helix transcriptional regulator [Streptomyces sp. XM4193]|nr:helix-turn-helix transcriptional regulator [Streptomyces sp. XM4193]
MRRFREDRGWSQDLLAERTEYSGQHISAVETVRKPPTLPFARRLDRAFGIKDGPDSFEREWRDIRHGSLLEGFPEYVSRESSAVEIRLYNVGIIPGLLQTPAYARVLAESAVRRGAIPSGHAVERVEFLAERQAALTRPSPPAMLVVMDESCIRRSVGGESVMREQFDRLLEFAQLPHTVLQIAPFSMGELRPFNLPVNLLTLPDLTVVAYAESQLRGHLERDAASVLPLLSAYHQLQAESLSQAASVAMIEELRKGNP